MTTAAITNEHNRVETENTAKESNPSSIAKETSTNEGNSTGEKAKNVFNKLGSLSHSVIGNTGKAIGNLLPTASLQSITQPRFSMPDKTVASQVLMYRQLLHTACRPGLRLSRAYQGTKAQKAVIHMPWWEQGIEDSGKMVISYDNLIVRLWLNGAIMPFADLLGGDVQTMIDDKGLPPIPHEFWVDRLGFQQPDPVTDFRSGGVLSLAMLVHMVESCMPTVKRFHPDGDASVLPFGITCINVTDMMAKFLMLAKSVDRMETLMSQKPFWRMFADPNAILAVQEISMNMLCDVVVEMNRERKIPNTINNNVEEVTPGGGNEVTVFDFAEVLERTERRVRVDLLGAGPKTVEELQSVAGRLQLKYKQQLEAKERRQLTATGGRNKSDLGKVTVDKAVATAESTVSGATNIAAGFFEKIKSTRISTPTFAIGPNKQAEENETKPTIVDIPPPVETNINSTVEDDWMGVTKADTLP
eukprot:CAMPEP_0194232612 /NCGR_PEP_ID=MMETSP0158-20130606/919_1 /TAXON_ID=33649 /ORGANISM="Thalassionema nitzschioides, Strain L26-B" /LENGTH=472 /DNA_ID=CAMNT_0038965401 /DNA_START=461 /DNA_END=1876 /DNA_ORIENTATION=+